VPLRICDAPKAKLAAAEIDREAVCLPAGRRASKDSQVT
jgi:hypothetical protein